MTATKIIKDLKWQYTKHLSSTIIIKLNFSNIYKQAIFKKIFERIAQESIRGKYTIEHLVKIPFESNTLIALKDKNSKFWTTIWYNSLVGRVKYLFKAQLYLKI